MLEDKIKQMLLKVVKDSIYSGIHKKDIIDKEELVKKFPNFTKRAATFVTLNLNGELRSCVGSLVAHKTLLDDLIINGCEACGITGVKAIVDYAKVHNCKVQLCDYRTSADVSGDKESVVGYTSFLLGL